jgi:hypothetical protein
MSTSGFVLSASDGRQPQAENKDQGVAATRPPLAIYTVTASPSATSWTNGTTAVKFCLKQGRHCLINRNDH